MKNIGGFTKNAPLGRRMRTNYQIGFMRITMHKSMSEHHFSKGFTKLHRLNKKTMMFTSLNRVLVKNTHFAATIMSYFESMQPKDYRHQKKHVYQNLDWFISSE